ncbi:MAG: hypothetical protein EZS28_033603 [Streblomastix strix]|uniref:Uncharacterized protein n=1 Tax=Streblomastix strix TaxID=222440 RepID=A0A5J4UL93_9EUKA|nr:MAG: hypothetical protein EZS28_033603 [Streblomastix strix]
MEQELLTNELERIVADGTNDNGDEDQSEHTIDPTHFTNENDGFRRNDNGTQLRTIVNGEANPEINITKKSACTPLHNVNGLDILGGNGCGMQLQAATNENEHFYYQTIENTSKVINNEQANDIKTGGNANGQGTSNESQHEQGIKHQDNGNTKLKWTESLHATLLEQELGNPNILQPKNLPSLIFTPPELEQFKGKVVIPKQRMQPTNDYDTRNKIGLQMSLLDKSLGSPEAKANVDYPKYFTLLQERRKNGRNSPGTGSKKQKQGFNSDNQTEIDLDPETDRSEQLL